MSDKQRAQSPRSNAAQRQARYRTRQILGIRLVQAEVDLSLLEELISAGHLSAPVSEDAQSVAEALVTAARHGCGSTASPLPSMQNR